MQTIGKYEVLDVLGYGGMGVVYRARDNAIDREVALKVMSAALSQQGELRERFLREARAAGKLQHPNIVVIFDLGEHEGAPYIAMEYLAGQPLDKAVESGSLSVAQKLAIFTQVCDGLQFAHENGIVHRDVKPANVIVLRDGRAKLVDFGIARTGDAKLTKTGMVIGTVAYMAPEQLRGKHVDARSDVFAAGVLLYELLSGKLPFEGESTAETMIKILQDEPAELQLDGVISPEALAVIVRKALEKDPEARYQSAREFGAAVRGYMKAQERGMDATVVRARPEAQAAAAGVQRTRVSDVEPAATRIAAAPAEAREESTDVAATSPAAKKHPERWIFALLLLLLASFVALVSWRRFQELNGPSTWLTPGAEPELDKSMQRPPLVVKGEVKDKTGSPVNGATVILLNGRSRTIAAVWTDDAGRFQFDAFPNVIALQVSATGFRSLRCQLSVAAGETSRHAAISLVPGNKDEVDSYMDCGP